MNEPEELLLMSGIPPRFLFFVGRKGRGNGPGEFGCRARRDTTLRFAAIQSTRLRGSTMGAGIAYEGVERISGCTVLACERVRNVGT